MTQTPPQPPSAERRGSLRFTLLFRTAKLVVDEKEYLCVMRNASATGAKIQLFHTLPVGADFAIEVGNGVRYPSDVMWSNYYDVGLRFKQEIDLCRLLSDNHDQYPRRPPRLEFNRPAQVTAQGRTFETLLRNLSQQGACIESPNLLPVFEPIKIECEGLPIIFGKVCWRRFHQHGVVFEQGFGLEELARYVERLHHKHARQSAP